MKFTNGGGSAPPRPTPPDEGIVHFRPAYHKKAANPLKKGWRMTRDDLYSFEAGDVWSARQEGAAARAAAVPVPMALAPVAFRRRRVRLPRFTPSFW